MTSQIILIVLFSGLFIGGLLGYFLRLLISLQKKASMEFEIKKQTLAAKEKASKIIEESERKVLERETESKENILKKEEAIQKREARALKKEELLDGRQLNIDQTESDLRERLKDLDLIRAEVLEEKKKNLKTLEHISGLSAYDAKEELLSHLEKEFEGDLLMRLRKLESVGRSRLEDKAKEILATAIHRYGNAVSSDLLTTTVNIPNEEAKGKIIGKEGRNIRSFEKAAGVDLVIDDTPGVVTISAFDPVRRQIAKRALETLIADGRVQPAKIEEHVEKAGREIAEIIRKKGEEAAYECGIANIDPRLATILGRLHFRTSFGQNVLQHSIEMAHIAGVIAEELGVDAQVARAGALFHDIGKAVDHEVQGTHVQIGRKILQKFGVAKPIIDAMQSHHEEYPYETPEAVIVQVADAISGGRPGARRDTAENYIQRLTDLENLANSFEGVEKTYVLQAGREIRVFVAPKDVSDLDAQKIARELAIRIEEELKYPGEIKISIIRETRYIEYAR